MKIAIVGAGAAGCFAAIEIKRLLPEAEVIIYEAAKRPLIKLGLTGGGRCNLTNSFENVKSMQEVYPRGARLMQRLIKNFTPEDVCNWYQKRGVKLTTQEDQCVFPKSQKAEQIVHTLFNINAYARVEIKNQHKVTRIFKDLTLEFSNGQKVQNDVVLVATGGCSKTWATALEELGLEVKTPLPSLFSFVIDEPELKALQGIIVQDAETTICGTKVKASGTVLVTDWGLSGPGILKLSARGAVILCERAYQTKLAVIWLGAW